MGEIDLSAGADSIVVVPDILYGNDFLRRTKILIIDGELPNVLFLDGFRYRSASCWNNRHLKRARQRNDIYAKTAGTGQDQQKGTVATALLPSCEHSPLH
jgi:hypothetical protein